MAEYYHTSQPTDFALFLCGFITVNDCLQLFLIIKSVVGKDMIQCHLKESEIVKGFK